jgi:WD40 repeat protein
MTVDGSETVRLTATRAVERDPAVSSDGLRVAFTRGTKAGADELWIGDLQGRSQRKIIPRRPASIRYATTGNPAWSPDDRWIYLDRAAQGPNEICGWIYRVGAEGRGLVQVTRGVHIDSRPAPSPDGSRIALTNGGCEPGGRVLLARRRRPPRKTHDRPEARAVHARRPVRADVVSRRRANRLRGQRSRRRHVEPSSRRPGRLARRPDHAAWTERGGALLVSRRRVDRLRSLEEVGRIRPVHRPSGRHRAPAPHDDEARRVVARLDPA